MVLVRPHDVVSHDHFHGWQGLLGAPAPRRAAAAGSTPVALLPEADSYQPQAPWPAMRGRLHNSGCDVRLLAPPPRSDLPVRVWHTGNAVFSTPIIGPQETIYVGSADKSFYAFDALTGQRKWSFVTQECIDSAACIGRDGTLYVPSCDGRIYALDPDGKQKWSFDALRDRVGYSPSTIYWWEGNLELGPTGLLYGGNDNFYLYALEPCGTVRWARPTGMNIWSAPAFDAAGHLFGASFDMHAFCLDAATGAQRWRVNTGNLVAASPALGADGAVYLGNLGGTLHALDGATGKTRWRVHTGGHIYASVAVAPDEHLFVGSADGLMYCIDGHTGKVQWTFYTGDAIRSSAAVGPDPEGRVAYLVYFGGGNGVVYALEPNGARRWSFDAVVAEACRGNAPPACEYRNINASVALGKRGLATASASGDVLYIPYDAYLTQAGFERSPTDGFPRDGIFLDSVSPGGTLSTSPSTAIDAHGAQTLALRLLVRRDGQTVPGKIEGATVTILPPLAHRCFVQPKGDQLSIELLELPTVGQMYDVHVDAPVTAAKMSTRVSQNLQVRALPVDAAPSLQALEGLPLRLSHLALYDPAVVPSFDQIGLASLCVDLQVIHVDAGSGACIAWGVLPFGGPGDGASANDDVGPAVGVARERHLFFAFNGTYKAGHFSLESLQPWLEITAMPVPLDRLHLAGTWPRADPSWVDGGSVVADLQVPSLATLMGQLLRGRVPVMWRALASARASTQPRAARASTWPWRHVLIVRRSLGMLWRLLTGKIYRAWQLVDDQAHFTALGTFRLSRAAPSAQPLARLASMHVDRRRGQVVAQVALGASPAPILSMAVIDLDACRVLPLDYNTATTVQVDAAKQLATVRLQVPRAVVEATKQGRRYKVVVMQRCQVLGSTLASQLRRAY